MLTRSSALSDLLDHWNANGWPLSTLTAFRMEGEGGGGDAGTGAGEGGEGQSEGGGGSEGGGDQTDWKAEAEKWKALSRKHETNSGKTLKELEQLRQSQMSDQEKAVAQAVADAKAAGRAEALIDVGGQLVQAEVRAAAAGRLTPEQLTVLVDGLNVAAFLTDTGEVDRDKVAKYVDGIAPATGVGNTRFPDLGQGTRNGSNGSLNGDPLERALREKLGIR